MRIVALSIIISLISLNYSLGQKTVNRPLFGTEKTEALIVGLNSSGNCSHPVKLSDGMVSSDRSKFLITPNQEFIFINLLVDDLFERSVEDIEILIVQKNKQKSARRFSVSTNGSNYLIDSLIPNESYVIELRVRAGIIDKINLCLSSPLKKKEKGDRVRFINDSNNYKSNSGVFGYTPGEFTVGNSGVANYTIPLVIPNGAAGIKPSINISYNSNLGNGLLGDKFSISGFHLFNRVGKNYEYDKEVRAPDFSSEDRFAFDGIRLVNWSNLPYGADQCEYRLEKNTHLKIESYGKVGSGPERFKTWSKDGFIYEYGYTEDSRIESTLDGAGIENWLINKKSDRSGNEINYFYDEDIANGYYYPLRIEYVSNPTFGISSTNSIEFTYEDRNDIIESYLAGSLTRITKRLREIEIKEGSTVIRSYSFEYRYDPLTQKSQIVSITECGINDECLNPTLFEWEENNSFENLQVTTVDDAVPSDTLRYTLDYTPFNMLIRKSDAGGNIFSKKEKIEYQQWLQEHFDILEQSQQTVGDINGDGFNDKIIVYPFNEDYNAIFIDAFVNKGNYNFVEESNWIYSDRDLNSGELIENARAYHILKNAQNYLVYTEDFNSDSYVDFMFHDTITGKNIWHFNKAQDTRRGDLYDFDDIFETDRFVWYDFEEKINLIPPSLIRKQSGHIKFIDFTDYNSDGLLDVAIGTDADNKDLRYYLKNQFDDGYSLNVGLIPEALSTEKNVNIDFDGDGQLDFFWVDEAEEKSYWFKNSSTAFPSPKLTYELIDTNAIPYNQINTLSEFKAADFNGDGLQDLLYYKKVDSETPQNKFYVYINQGNLNFKRSSEHVLSGSISKFLAPVDWWLTPYDINGDGRADLLNYDNNTGELDIYLNQYQESSKYIFGDSININQAAVNSPFNLPISPNLMKGGGGLIPFATRNGTLFSMLWHDPSALGEELKNRIIDLDADLTKTDIKKIINGHGQIVQIEHGFTTDENLYRKDDNRNYPEIDYSGPRKVVKSYKIYGDAGLIQYRSFRYRNGKIHVWGKGFRGFEEFEDTDRLTGERKLLKLNTGFHEAPIKQAITYNRSGNIISELVYSSRTDTLFSPLLQPIYNVYNDSTTEKYYGSDSRLDFTEVLKTEEQDSYGNVTKVEVIYPNIENLKIGASQVITTSEHYIDEANWLIGRTKSISIEKISQQGESDVRNAAFIYDDKGYLKEEISAPDLTEQKIITEYTRDQIGNIIQKSVTTWNGSNNETRTTLYEFDPTGRYQTKIINNLGHNYSRGFGLAGLTAFDIDQNGLISIHTYDSFGRKIRTDYPDGNFIEKQYQRCQNCPNDAFTKITTTRSNAPPSIVYYDMHDRVILTENIGFEGKKVFTETQYDNLSRPFRQSEPYFEGESPIWHLKEYDDRHRVVKTVSPGGVINSVTYDHLKTTYTNALGQVKIIKKSSNGLTTSVVDNGGSTIKYEYDLDGRLAKIIRPNQFGSINFEYDYYSNRTNVVDPEMGEYEYEYNNFGELIRQISPNEEIITLEYDGLGRNIKRIESFGETITTYDGANKGIGIIQAISGPHSTVSFDYDQYSRLTTENVEIEGVTYTSFTQYNSDGRIERYDYPSDLSLSYSYDAQGTLDAITNTTTGYEYYKVEDIDSYGRVVKEKYGNDVVSENHYERNRGFLLSQKATKSNVTLQELSYTYDDVGNLLSQTNHFRDYTESYQYDHLNRLTRYKIPNIEDIRVEYDIAGNITYKSDVGTYTYNEEEFIGTSPYQLKKIEKSENSCTPYSLLAQFSYNSFDKVDRISNDSISIDFKYGYDRQRVTSSVYKQNQLLEKRTYVGSALEILQDSLGAETKIFYIRGLNGVIATVNIKSNTQELQYWHKNFQGSVQTISDANGLFLIDFAYDPWGKRRNPVDGSTLVSSVSNINHRGYTGHEHIELFDLINMNGRIHDPILGRFISPDPVIVDLTNLQNLNRYSYVFNNPLRYTDPSGFMPETSAEQGEGRYENFRLYGEDLKGNRIDITGTFITDGQVHSHIQRKPTLLTQAIGFVIQVVASKFLGPIAGSALSAFTTSMLTGYSFGTALKAAGTAAAFASLSAGAANIVGNATSSQVIGNSILRAGAKGLGHGITQGAIGSLQGRDFWSSAASGFASGAGEVGLENGLKNGWYSAGSIGHFSANALIGGTGSAAAGGNFLDGAVTGTVVLAFNYMMTEGGGDSKMSDREKHLKETQEKIENRKNRNLQTLKPLGENIIGDIAGKVGGVVLSTGAVVYTAATANGNMNALESGVFATGLVLSTVASKMVFIPGAQGTAAVLGTFGFFMTSIPSMTSSYRSFVPNNSTPY